VEPQPQQYITDLLKLSVAPKLELLTAHCCPSVALLSTHPLTLQGSQDLPEVRTLWDAIQPANHNPPGSVHTAHTEPQPLTCHKHLLSCQQDRLLLLPPLPASRRPA